MQSTMSPNVIDRAESPARRSPRPSWLRATEIVAGAALAVVAGIHLLAVSTKLSETPYLGVGYIGLIVGAIISVGLLLRGDKRGWVLGGGLCLATMIGFTLTRTTGLPASTDDIGNWSEPAGTYALIAEGLVVVASVVALRHHRKA